MPGALGPCLHLRGDLADGIDLVVANAVVEERRCITGWALFSVGIGLGLIMLGVLFRPER
jgi:hypothetical protein